MCRPVRLPLASSAPTSLHCVTGWYRPCVMSSSRDQISLTGVPGICLAISTAWRHVVVEGAAPAEAAAEVDLVDLALVGRQAGGRRRRGERGLAVLRRAPRPRSAPACSAPSRSSAPSARGSGTDRRRPPRPSSPRRRWRPSRRRSGCRRRPARRRGRPSASSAIVALETLAFGPSSQTMGSASSAVLACHQVSATTATAVSPTCTHLLDARHARDLGGVEALHLAAEHRAVLDRGVEHAGQLQVDAVDLRAGHLVERVEALHRLADDLPVLRVLERHVRRRRQLARRPPRPCRTWSCGRRACA